jgi:hypothetical protein
LDEGDFLLEANVGSSKDHLVVVVVVAVAVRE